MRGTEIVDMQDSWREEPFGARLRILHIEPVWEQQEGKLRDQKLLTVVAVKRQVSGSSPMSADKCLNLGGNAE